MLSSLRVCARVRFGSVEQFTTDELAVAQKYVEETLRSRTWVTYMLASYLPQPVRPAYYAIHLLDMELTKISENAREPSLAQGKINFWREAVHRIYSGQKPQPEPLCVALHHAVHNNPLTNGYFQRMISVRGTEIGTRSIASIGEMRRMADDSKSTLLALTLELLRIEVANDHMR
jgi:phytoene/squalene synthetase